MKIRAAIARANQPFTIEECELSSPAAREVLVKVEACGMCHTDLTLKDHSIGTQLPAVMGHEGVGRIESVGEGVTDFKAGDRVLMSFGACGQCASCQKRLPGYCQHAMNFNLFGRRLDGTSPITLNGQPITGHFFAQSSFATHAVAAITNLVKLDEDLPATMVAPLACGVQTGMGSVMNVLRPGPDDSIAIFGCGTVGLSAVIAAKMSGCKQIIGVDIKQSRVDLALELGATHAINSAREDAAAEIGKLGGLTRAFDTTGLPPVIEAAYSVLRPQGLLVLAGVGPIEGKISIDPTMLMGTGRVLRGTIEGDANPPDFIPKMIAWYRSGELPMHKLVTTYELDQINQAAMDMESGRAVKPVLRMPTQ